MQMKMSLIVEQLPLQLREEIIKYEPIASLLQEGIPLSQVMLSELTFIRLYNDMKHREKQTIKLIVRHFATQPFDLLALQGAANESEISGAEVTAGLVSLRRKGIIFAMRKHWGENNYYIPTDMLGIWHQLVMEPTVPWEDLGDDVFASNLDVPSVVIVNLFLFLNYIEHHEVVLTRNGEIPKRHIRKMLEQLQWNEEFLCIWKPKHEYRVVYPIQMALIIELADKLLLIHWNLTNLTLRSANLIEWLQLSKAEMTFRIYAIFQDVFVPGSIADEHFLAKINALSSQKWYLLEDFISWLREYDIIILFNDWIVFLLTFGWIEQALDHQARSIFRLKLKEGISIDKDVPQGKFYVQSDYEILVPPDVSFTVRWELSFIADHIRTDQVGVYRLNERSLQRAIWSGRSLEQCLQFLNEYSFYGVPESIQFVLKQWVRSAIPCLLIPQKVVLMELEGKDTAAVGSIRDLSPCELAVDIPSRDEVYPLWQTIPPLWWKECREYHTSTQKEIAQLAIKWKAILKLKNGNKTWSIIPKQIQERKEGWNLLGWTQSDLVSYSQDQWQAMQLILPGFDDLFT
jgi:hypothetical protein